MAKRKSKGTIIRRGKSKVWYLAISEQGRMKFVRLLKPDGDRVENEEEAETAANAYRALGMLGDKAAQLRTVAAELKTVEERAAEIIEERRPKLPIADMWEKHPYTVNTRGSRERDLSPGTIKDNLSQWKHFTDWAESRKVKFAEDVTGDHAAAFRRHLAAAGLSGSRQNQIAGLCRVMFRLAKIEPNPFDGIRQKSHNPRGRRELTTDELKAVCTAATGELRTLLAIGLYTGLRLGDAARLEWREIAPDFSKIIRLPSKTAYRGRELTIPVHPVLSAILQETPPAARVGFVLPETGAKYTTDKAAVSRAIQEHFTACGIRTHREGTGFETVKDETTGKAVKRHTGKRASVEVGFHSLRHSFVSICARQGVPLHVVQALCGHSTPAVQKLYLHHSTEDTTRAINSLPAIGEKAATDPEEAADRRRLADLVATLPIGKVRELLAVAG